MTDTIAVVAAAVAFEGVVLEDGTTIAVELNEPRQRWAICHRSTAGVEIIAMRDSEEEAIDHAKRLVGAMAGTEGGTTLQ